MWLADGVRPFDELMVQHRKWINSIMRLSMLCEHSQYTLKFGHKYGPCKLNGTSLSIVYVYCIFWPGLKIYMRNVINYPKICLSCAIAVKVSSWLWLFLIVLIFPQLSHADTVEGLVLINIDPNAKGWMDWAAHKVRLRKMLSCLPSNCMQDFVIASN